MVDAILIAINVLLMIAAAASAAMWIVLIRNRILQPDPDVSFLESIVPSRPRSQPLDPLWMIASVLVMLGSMILVGSLVSAWMIQQGWMQQPPTAAADMTVESLLASTVASTIAGLSAAAILITWLRLFHGDAHRQLGLTVTSSDVGLGLKAALMLLPPVLLISAGVNHYVQYEHTVLNVLAELSTPVAIAAIFFGTAIVTPFVEELLFRVLLQGALQGLADRGGDEAASWRPQAYWPIVASSAVFASLHLGQGAAPIPLFVLALGLGFLYRQTGCIVVPVIVHMVLNGLTLLVEVAKQVT
jgi:membrane protease YdiL (CAAX protease family)